MLYKKKPGGIVPQPDTDMRNVHRMFITYIHRTSESRNTKNTYDFLVQVRNFLLKVLRERYTIFLWWLLHLPKTRVAPATRPREQAKVNRLHPRQDSTQLTDFFKIPKILRARFRCMTSFTSTSQPFYRIFILTSMNDTLLPERALTPALKFAPN